MLWLKQHFPVLFSPTFWGVTFTAVFATLAHYKVLDEWLLNTIAIWIGSVTGVGFTWKTASKVGVNRVNQ